MLSRAISRQFKTPQRHKRGNLRLSAIFKTPQAGRMWRFEIPKTRAFLCVVALWRIANTRL